MTDVPEMTAQEVAAAIAGGKIVLIDVREPAEFAAERIHGALLSPLSTFDAALLPRDPARPIVLHCGSGKRSAKAYEACVKAGVSVRAHMQGGLGAWKSAGLPMITLDPASGAVTDKR